MTHRCKHVDAIKEELRALGATDITSDRKDGDVRIHWRVRGRPNFIVVEAHPRDVRVASTTGRQDARRACHEARPS